MVIIMKTDSGKIIENYCGQTYTEEVLNASWINPPAIEARLQTIAPTPHPHSPSTQEVSSFMTRIYLAEGLKGRA